MRMTVLLPIAGLLLPWAPAAAADGALGARSTGHVRITVSVAPRAWVPSAERLCVAAPASGYSLRLAESATTLAAAGKAPAGICVLNAQAIALPASLATSGQTLLIVAE